MTFETYSILGAAAIVFILIIWLIVLEVRIHKLLKGKEGSLDEAMGNLRKDTDYLKKYTDKATEKFQSIDKKLSRTISGNETVRFNPFKGDGSGGNQSFATALINSAGDGVVISSLYSRGGVSIFSKPVKNFSSEYELSGEERAALQKAKESLI